MDEILSALSCIPVRECSYAEWLGIGMALKDAGYTGAFAKAPCQGRDGLLPGTPVLDTVDNSQINVLTQRTMHRICTAATNEEVSFAYRVAIPRQRFRWRNAFSTRWRSL